MRKIAIFTGTRAEYGLLFWIIKGIHESKNSKLQLMVGGMHLSPEFGKTINEITKDRFPITDTNEFILSSDSKVGIAKSMGLAIISSAESFQRNKPDLLIILGDRFETLAVAQAAMISKIPIAHIHGGELTEGQMDEAIRHSLTKMSHFHFAATEEYRDRIIQLGENPKNVFNYGAPGIDSIKKLKLLKKDELFKKIGFCPKKPYFMLTYHPETLAPQGGRDGLISIFKALHKYLDYNIVISYPNADAESRGLIDIINKYKEENPERVFLSKSLGQLIYLSLLKNCELVIGNSSSGLIEAPSFNIPTINIGNRQEGRIKGVTVIDCNSNLTSISASLDKALSNKFKKICSNAVNPYGSGNASKRIVSFLEKVNLKSSLMKKFHNIKK